MAPGNRIIHHMNRRHWLSSLLLLVALAGVSAFLIAWRHAGDSDTPAAAPPEPAEAVTVAIAQAREHRRTSTSIGTVLALRSVTLQNELPGTVREVTLEPGAVVEPGQVLVALDVSVEQAELAALKAQAALADTNLRRIQRLVRNNAAPVAEEERAIAERDVAQAQIARVEAIIERKTIRAPFRARVGLADVHPGQFLEAGTVLTTIQGVDTAAHVDFDVAQHVAAELSSGDRIELLLSPTAQPVPARIVALDARIDPATRNAAVRARVDSPQVRLAPGASVRVRVAQGPSSDAVAIPASALRRGPAGDQVFVIESGPDGSTRAHARTVKTGPAAGNEVLVLAGLSPGERVAASGSFKLREAALVAIVNQSALASNAR